MGSQPDGLTPEAARCLLGVRFTESDERRLQELADCSQAGMQSQIQASREASISDFGLDVEQDLLRSVTGKPRVESFGVTLSGKDALNTKVQVSLKTLPERLAAYLKAFADIAYKQNFPWVDHISALKDPRRLPIWMRY